MTATLRIPRSRGALSGSLLVLLGLWGALVPLVGSYSHFGFAPDKTWDFTSGRIWLQIVPGAAVALGGLIALVSANRVFATFGAWLAVLGGAWLAVCAPLSALWHGNIRLGQALGSPTRQVWEQITLLYGLGVVAVFLAAVALGRLAVVGVKDAVLAEERRQEQETPGTAGDDRATATAAITGPMASPATEPQRAVSGPRARWPEALPSTSAEPVSTSPSDVRVAGAAESQGINGPDTKA